VKAEWIKDLKTASPSMRIVPRFQTFEWGEKQYMSIYKEKLAMGKVAKLLLDEVKSSPVPH
jgi:hypothetical protein